MWEIQNRLKKRPMVQPEHGLSPHGPGCCGGTWLPNTALRQVQDTAEPLVSPGPQDMVGQLRQPSAAMGGHGLCGTVRRSCLEYTGLCLRTADEPVKSLRARAGGQINVTLWWVSAADHLIRTKQLRPSDNWKKLHVCSSWSSQ